MRFSANDKDWAERVTTLAITMSAFGIGNDLL